MRRRHRTAAGPVRSSRALAALLLAFTLPVVAQEEAREEPAAEDEAPAEESFEAIDDLLAMDEEVLSSPQTYSYDPGARRDPFRSLIQRRSAAAPEGERPEGVPGLLIDEIEIQGVFITPAGPVAQVQSAAQETSYLIRPGDQLWDGEVVSISLEEVLFRQAVNDPTALRPFREVVKKLDPNA